MSTIPPSDWLHAFLTGLRAIPLNSWIKMGLLLAIVLLTLLRWQVQRRGWRRGQIVLNVLAGLGVVVAAYSIVDKAAPWKPRFLNNHDVYHYYFGSKYSDELGYYNIYHCTLIALDEGGAKKHRNLKKMRNQYNYEHTPKKYFLERRKWCTDRFSPIRWAEFKEDLKKYDTGRSFTWAGLTQDKGYNPSPVWNLVARQISSHISPLPWWEFNILGMIDLLLLAVALIFAAVAFGGWGAALGAMYVAACWSLTPTHIRGGFMRLDWLAMLIAGLAALQLKRPKLAGALLAYAAMVRVFPVLFLFGAGVKGLLEWHRTRRLPRRYVTLFGSFGLSCALLFGMTVLDDGGLWRWREFSRKMQIHTRDIATMRIGLEYLIGYQGESSSKDYRDEQGRRGFRPHWVGAKIRHYEAIKPVTLGLAAAILILLGWLLRRRDDLEVVALSWIAVFCLVNPTFYYYCLLAPVVLVLASRTERAPMRILLIGFPLMELFVHLEFKIVKFEVQQYWLQTVGVGVMVLLTLFVLWWYRKQGIAQVPRLAEASVGGGAAVAVLAEPVHAGVGDLPLPASPPDEEPPAAPDAQA